MEQNTEAMHSYIYSQWLTGCQEHTMGEKMISSVSAGKTRYPHTEES